MPKIVVEVRVHQTPRMMQNSLRLVLLREGIPEYSWKEQRAGFEVWHAEEAEGQVTVIWHTFVTEPSDEASAEMRAGLEKCAAVLLENYWVQLYVPNRLKMMNRRMHLRVLRGLNWL